MVALATQVLLLFGLGQIQATLAPDQPVPSVYIDEPLVIEFLSPVDTTCSVELDLYVPGQEPRRISLGSHRIAAGRRNGCLSIPCLPSSGGTSSGCPFKKATPQGSSPDSSTVSSVRTLRLRFPCA